MDGFCSWNLMIQGNTAVEELPTLPSALRIHCAFPPRTLLFKKSKGSRQNKQKHSLQVLSKAICKNLSKEKTRCLIRMAKKTIGWKSLFFSSEAGFLGVSTCRLPGLRREKPSNTPLPPLLRLLVLCPFWP